MKSTPWEPSLALSSDESSESDTDDDELVAKNCKTKDGQSSKDNKSEALESKKKHTGMSFEALSKHGYRGGPSIFRVPPPKPEDPDWSWSTGKRSEADKNVEEESYADRQRTRAALAQAEEHLQANIDASNNKKNMSFSQKEKRKRDLGQASRGKSYVEEEKRLLRDNGVYSGFDS